MQNPNDVGVVWEQASVCNLLAWAEGLTINDSKVAVGFEINKTEWGFIGSFGSNKRERTRST